MLNLSATLEYSAKTNPDDPAIYFSNKVFSYNEVNLMANKIANGLINSGIKKVIKLLYVVQIFHNLFFRIFQF